MGLVGVLGVDRNAVANFTQLATFAQFKQAIKHLANSAYWNWNLGKSRNSFVC